MCSVCAEEMYEHYKKVLGSDRAAMYRMCMKFDLYWSPKIFGSARVQRSTTSRFRSYVSQTNLMMYHGKTFDDTLDEEETPVVLETALAEAVETTVLEPADEDADVSDAITPEVLEFWGGGFMRDYYPELERRYQNWTAELPKPLDRATEALYRQVCILETTINRNVAAGKAVEQSVNALNTLLGSLNAKPVQKQQEQQAEAPFDALPFGVGIKMCENVRPIGETKYKDVDGLKAITHAYMYGHLAKMVGIRNGDCRLYEEEMARMRVARPEYADESDDDFLADIFEDALTKKIGHDEEEGESEDGGAPS